jgi:hypothetical protein
VRVVVDPKSALYVTGSELDYIEALQDGGFKVKNPERGHELFLRRKFQRVIGLKVRLLMSFHDGQFCTAERTAPSVAGA